MNGCLEIKKEKKKNLAPAFKQILKYIFPLLQLREPA